jgi:Flp pilus assembly pilin Flp
MKTLKHMWHDDGGQDVIEYALIGGLVSVVAYAIIQGAGGSVNTLWTSINSDLSSAA